MSLNSPNHMLTEYIYIYIYIIHIICYIILYKINYTQEIIFNKIYKKKNIFNKYFFNTCRLCLVGGVDLREWL